MTPDAKRFVFSGNDEKINYESVFVRVGSLEDGSVVKEFKTEAGGVIPVAITPDGKRVVFGGNAFRVADVETGEIVLTLKRRDGGAFSEQQVQLSNDGRTIWTFSGQEILGFDIESGEEMQVLRSGDSRVQSVYISDDDSYVAAGYMNGGIRVFDLATGEAQILEAGSEMDPDPLDSKAKSRKVIAFDAPKNGNLLSVSRSNHDMELWDMEKGAQTATLPTREGSNATALSDGGRYLIAQASWLTPEGKPDYSQKHRNPLHVYETATRQCVAYLVIPGDGASQSAVWNMAFSSDGMTLHAGVGTGEIHIFDLTSILK